MEVCFKCCCGLDVHKESIKANLLRRGVADKSDLSEVRSFGTTTNELLKMADWLREEGCTHVAMESTGVYWKPIFNILESDFEVVLVNAKHIKTVPGRKTDVKDCQWIGQLLQHGLLRASFIPPKPIRELRDLTRSRKGLIQSRATVANRIQKVLEDANIKLSSVATDVLGKSGWNMLERIVKGETDPAELSELALGRMKSKKEQLRYALEGRITAHHRFLLEQLMDQIRYYDSMIEKFDERIGEQVSPFFEQTQLMDTIPGVNQRVIECVIAEIGMDMDQFPTDRHLCSWAGVSPGSNESAGKHKSGRITKGNRWLKASLSEAGWAASHTKNTYLSAQYKRLASRRGKKRALIAVAHTILIIIYHVLKNNVTYNELGGDYFDRINSEHLKKYFIKRLESLGLSVEVKEQQAA